MDNHPRRAFLESIQGAPLSKLIGMTIERAGDGEVQLRLPFDERLLNLGGPAAPVHGGAIATLVDTAACAAVWTLPETVRSATVSITVNYTSAAIQSDLIAVAKVRRKGKSLASVAIEVRDNRNSLIADGLVTYKIA